MFSVFILLITLASPSGMLSQDSKPAGVPSPEIPKKPAEILRFAFLKNGIDTTASAKPWHVKLSYDEFDEEGDNVHSGTFEEFYVGPKKYRRSYTGDTLTQIDIATESGLYRSGDQQWPSPLELQVRNEALQPLYRVSRNTTNTRSDKISWQVGSTKLSCIILRRTDLIISDNGLPKFCFDPNTVMLRYTRGRGWDETTYNNFTSFHGRYVARDINITQGGKPFLNIHIEKLEDIPSDDESLFMPPAGNSGPLGGRIAISSDILIDEYLIRAGRLIRPRTGSGKAKVNFVVGKNGSVIHAEAVDGSAEVQEAALAAIRGYMFRPFLILDQPVEVESNMSFEIYQ